MATRSVSLFTAACCPDASGKVYPVPASLHQANDLVMQQVIAFAASTTKNTLGGRFDMPADYVGSPVFLVEWGSTVTSGAVVWTVDHVAISSGATLDPSAATTTLTVTTATSTAAALNENESSLTASSSQFIAGRQVMVALGRNGASTAADTMTTNAYLYSLRLQYAST